MRIRKRLIYFTILFFSILLFINKSKNKILTRPGYDNTIASYSSYRASPLPVTAVIILTYMRSGSSLTGDILQQSPGAFYVFEPLHYLGSFFKLNGSSITFANGTIRSRPIYFDEEAVNIIRNWIECDVKKLPMRSLTDGFLGKGLRLLEYRNCYARNKSTTMDTCISRLKSECDKSPIRILKTIRLPLKLISHLMLEIPGLKIVHLVRDPRATLRSQMGFGMCLKQNGGTYNCTNRFCTRLENDKDEMEILSKRFKNRVTSVLYEEIAAKPIETAKKLYDFIGTTFTRNAKEYVFNITMAGNDVICPTCTMRANSSVYIDKWKSRMSPQFLQIIQERCKDILQYYNYSPVSL